MDNLNCAVTGIKREEAGKKSCETTFTIWKKKKTSSYPVREFNKGNMDDTILKKRVLKELFQMLC